MVCFELRFHPFPNHFFPPACEGAAAACFPAAAFAANDFDDAPPAIFSGATCTAGAAIAVAGGVTGFGATLDGVAGGAAGLVAGPAGVAV